MVKLFAWEPFVIEKLSAARETEMKKLRYSRLLEALNSCVGEFIPLVTKIVVFAIYVRPIHPSTTATHPYNSPIDIRHEEGFNTCVRLPVHFL